ncbi:MAG: GTPase Era [Buchnera aphidicola (Nurudea yanoniella)]
MKKIIYCGKITIVGKPNVGKSTLINTLVKSKISIVSKKPHTTQSNIIGIQNTSIFQAIYTDTPGISYKNLYFKNKKKYHYIKKLCKNSELTLLILDKANWTSEDDLVLNIIKYNVTPVIAIINKNDKISNKKILLPHIDFLKDKHPFKHILPISGKTGENINLLSCIVQKFLPKSEPKFLCDQITNYDLNFKIKEIIREKFIFYLRDELSYSIKIIVKNININKIGMYIIKANVFVKNNQHKKIVIGNNGKIIKLCGTMARKEIEKYLKSSVYLSIFVTKNKKIYSEI